MDKIGGDRTCHAVSPSASSLFRKIDRLGEGLILLLDELNNLAGEDAAAIREIINAGYRRGALVTRSVRMPDGNYQDTDYLVFCPKVIAGLGRLPNTTASRCFTILMEKRPPTATLEPFRPDRKSEQAKAAEIRSRLDRLRGLLPALKSAQPPDLFWLADGRQQEVAEPILILASMAGQDWEKRARAAISHAFSLTPDEEPLQIALLRDLCTIFDQERANKLTTRAIIQKLNDMEEAPWRDQRRGQGVNAHWLARALRRFRIGSKNMRTQEGGVGKGYEAAPIRKACELYANTPPTPNFGDSIRYSAANVDGQRVNPDFQNSINPFCGVSSVSKTACNSLMPNKSSGAAFQNADFSGGGGIQPDFGLEAESAGGSDVGQKSEGLPTSEAGMDFKDEKYFG
ncbi:DUF3631 domain-containing protein [Verrucomicrobium sp. 3C]|uniref:DUF3631 domain-containing protein n=1 Tax=Verrucomicrobium sp. 3C TaxID=1134055 RepID=UPI0012DE5858|nr:DUF3631 domain-containing protein [Verrucomicrobium sp. 3C]